METIEFLDSTYIVEHADGLVSRWFPTEQSRVRSKSKLPQGQVFKIKALCVLNTEEFGELVDGGWVLLSRENKTSIFAKEIDKQIVKETDAEEKLLQKIATWNPEVRSSYLNAKTELKAQEKDKLNRKTEVIKSRFIQQSHSDNKLFVSDKFEDEKDVSSSVQKYEEPLFVIEPTDDRVSHNTLPQRLLASNNENQTVQINQPTTPASSPLEDSIDAQENHTPEKGVWDTHNENIGESCDSEDDDFFMPDRSKSMTPSSGPANCGCVTSDSSSNYVEEDKKNLEREGKISARTNDNFDTKPNVDNIPSRTSNNGSKVKQEILKLNSSKNSAPLSPTPITSSKHPSSQTSYASPVRPPFSAAQVSFTSTTSVSTPSSRTPSYQPSSFKSKNPRSHSKKMKSTTLDPTQRHQILFGMPPPPSARPSPPASVTSTHSSVLEGEQAKSPFSSEIKSFHTLNRTSGLIGSSGSNLKNGDLDNPGGIALHKDVDDRMVLFVVNGKKHRVDVFDADSGDFIRVIGGGQGSGLNQLYFPTDIVLETISSETYMYVSDSWNHRIQVYNADTGEFARTLCMDKDEMTNAPILQFPTGLTLLPKNEEDDYFDFSSLLYVADSMNHRILVVRTDTGEQFLTIGNGRGKAEGKLNGPQGLLIYKTQLFVADSNNNRIQVFNAINGTFVRSIGSNASLRKPIGLTIFPKNATASGKDFLAVSDFEKDAVVIYDIPSGSIVDANTISRKGRELPDDICHSPRFMTTAVSPDNEYLLLFVSEGLLRNRIQVIQL